jgi:hypothetical protein
MPRFGNASAPGQATADPAGREVGGPDSSLTMPNRAVSGLPASAHHQGAVERLVRDLDLARSCGLRCRRQLRW